MGVDVVVQATKIPIDHSPGVDTRACGVAGPSFAGSLFCAHIIMDISPEGYEQAILGIDEAETWFEFHGYAYVLSRVTCRDGLIEERRSISKRDRFRIFTRDEFTCQYCGAKPPEVALVVDHIVPVSRSGRTVPLNLITSCEPCNQGKANKIFDARLACFYLEAIASKIGDPGY